METKPQVKRAFVESDPYVLPLTKLVMNINLGIKFNDFFSTEITQAMTRMDQVIRAVKEHDEIWFNSLLMRDSSDLFMKVGKWHLGKKDVQNKKIFNITKVPNLSAMSTTKKLIQELTTQNGFQFFFGDEIYQEYPMVNFSDILVIK